MDGHTYKQVEITGSSVTGTDDAIRNAVEKASKTIKNMRGFEVMGTRGYLDQGSIQYWQVPIKVGFRLED